jgi:hypothetical protein
MIYTTEINNNQLINIISFKSFTEKQKADIQIFRPRKVILSFTDPNILFIKNIQSVIIIKYSSTGILYINSIKALDSVKVTDSWEIVVGK